MISTRKTNHAAIPTTPVEDRLDINDKINAEI
jgi:hypothetical protein